MTAPAAFQADFVDLKFIKGRKVMQVVLELPIEAGASFVASFGTPNPASGTPVALARIDVNAKPEKPKGGRLAMRSGILCGEGGFWEFLKEQRVYGLAVTQCESSEDAAFWVRTHCGINSRAELDHNEDAASKFRDLESSYNAWLAAA